MAFPIPRVPPVMTATRPVKLAPLMMIPPPRWQTRWRPGDRG
jgi:hypothetical protein